jgi:Arc/MetJ-type ribon-helix-helix transcriptional regulator
MGIKSAKGTDNHMRQLKSKIVYIRLTAQMEEDLQRLQRLYPGNRSDLIRFAVQMFLDAHGPDLNELPQQEQHTT